MKKIAIAIIVLTVFANYSCKKYNSKSSDLTQFVNPFIGTGGHGHTYPGASLPFGMVQLSPDTRLDGWDGCSAYHYSDNRIYGFSHTHLSGTGCSDYGDILLMPRTGKEIWENKYMENGVDGYGSKFDKKNEKASPGFYSVLLNDYDIQVELTATKRCGFHKYTFSSDSGHVIIDLGHRDKVIDSEIKKENDHTISGFRRSEAWARDQHVYFVAEFSSNFYDSKTNELAEIGLNGTVSQITKKTILNFQTKENKEILVKVGISAVSVEGARKNLQAEIPDWNFEKVKNQAKAEWEKALRKIEVKSDDVEKKTIFYTSLYHSLLNPNLFMDTDGQYRGTDLKVHQAENYENYTVFSLWDTYRATHPLFTIIEQERTIAFIKTMLNHYNYGGQLPVWELAANYTGCMIGYHSIPVIADAYLKGINDFDAELALESMVASADKDHLGLKFYKGNGFITKEGEAESVSKTLEYAYDDWCIAMMAKKMGKTDIYERFIKRAQYYKNIFENSTGFMRAKENNKWEPHFDPAEVNFNFTEANSWQYSFYVPQDVTGFYNLLGGKSQLEAKLDALFSANEETTGREQADITGLIGQYAHGNEPSHHIAYLYNFVNKPHKTQEKVQKIMNELYSNAPDGLSGNEDCGQMSSWLVLSAMGFYSVTPGTDYYVIGSPWFDELKINLENGNSFIIKANGLKRGKTQYIQSTTLNGKNYSKSFIKHADLMNGGELFFEMGDKISDWGTSDEDIPVSEISEHIIVPVPFIIKGKRTFAETTIISLGCNLAGTKIHFTTDGSEPTNDSPIFEKEFEVSESTFVKAFAEKAGIQSLPIESRFVKIPIGRKIKIKNKYAKHYSAGGDLALIDIIRGASNFRTGTWQGYHQVDLDVTIDLGKKQTVNKLTVGFLQDIGSWIFMPEYVEFYISDDGENFKKIGKIENDISSRQLGANLKDFSLEKKSTGRYIRVYAKNRGICPDWHKGAGDKAWIFADEIIIE